MATNLWKPDYMLDIEVIDGQHKEFFQICLKATMLCEAGRKKPIQLSDIIHVLYSMRSYAFKHFHTEETLLLKYKYPNIYEHIALHDQFLASFQTFTADLHGRLSDSQGQEAVLACAEHINTYVVGWWGEHILNADQDYATYMRSRKMPIA